MNEAITLVTAMGRVKAEELDLETLITCRRDVGELLRLLRVPARADICTQVRWRAYDALFDRFELSCELCTPPLMWKSHVAPKLQRCDPETLSQLLLLLLDDEPSLAPLLAVVRPPN